MRQSKLFTKTYKEAPKGEESINAILLQRGGFIYKEMSGVYSFLPLGLRVLNKISGIVRQEMNNIDGQEVFMSVLQPKELWQKTDRWDKGIGKEIMYKTEDKSEVGLGPTHEEMLTDIVSKYVQSEDDLPFYIYQIQTKFRKEPRAKSGLLRGREFLMKDLYSFHTTEKDFEKYYEKVKQAYIKVYKRCGVEAIITEASGGGFTDGFSHEFQVLADSGEDLIIYCAKCGFSQNTEVAKVKAGDKCPECDTELKQVKSIEAGNIFPLGCKYSEALGAFFTDSKGNKKPIVMGCYGLGVSRLMGTVVEALHDEKGIIWPAEIAPFKTHLIALHGAEEQAEEIYKELASVCIEALFDDREDKAAGEKFADADLLGIPTRIVVSKKTLEQDSVELKQRGEEKTKLVKIKDLKDSIA